MSFNTGLSGLLSNSDQQNMIWRSLLQSFIDHGGSSRHLDKLLADANGDRKLIDLLVKQVIGSIWRIVQYPISITNLDTTIDFECSARTFLGYYPEMNPHPDHFADRSGKAEYTETIPSRPCKYRLVHFSKPPSFLDITEYRHGDNEEWAGWRELFAFANHQRNEDWSNYRILAPGSLSIDRYESRQQKKVVTSKMFPVAVNDREGKVDLSWRGFKRPETDRFDTQLFYLARVYDDY